ncbi:MAG: patatin-like phospholipase family protein [Alphaproteobacteria bacterium]
MAYKDRFNSKATNDNQKPRILLAFQGGGSHGAFAAGVINALEENGILADVQGVIGTSAGANNAACVGYALNKGDTALATQLSATLWNKIGAEGDKISHLKSFARAASFTQYPNLPQSFVSQMNLASQTGTMLGAKSQAGHVRDHIDDVIKDWDVIQNGSIPVVIGATLKARGSLIEYNFTNPDIDEDAIAASSCISGVHMKDGMPFIDGGYMKNPPLHGAFDESRYSDVLAIMLNPLPDAVRPQLQKDVQHITYDFIGPEVYRELAYMKENSDLNIHAIGMEFEPHWDQTSKLNFVSRWVGELYGRGYQAGLDWVKAHKNDLGVRSSFNPDILDDRALQAQPAVA